MRFIFIVLTLVLGICDAARRTTTTTTTVSTFGGRHREHPRQRQVDLENVWDLVELQKLDNRPNVWNKDPNAAANATESEDSEVLNTRQLYPVIPNPGDTNELPGPISPTIKPIPTATPQPGCYAMRGQFPSPKGCANYLNCWDDVVTEQTCPDSLLFNDITLVCDYDYNVNCGSRPMPTPKPPMPPGSKLCPEPNGRYRSATNCSEFFVCVYRKPIKFACPRGLVYNDVLSVCDYPYNVNCKGAATPGPTVPTQTSPSQPQPPTQPSQPPSQQPTYPPSPPYVPSQPQQPPYVPSQPQPPSLPPQQPTYPPSPPYVPSQPQQPPYVPPQPQQPPYVPQQPQQPPYVPQQPQQPPYVPQQPQQPSYGPQQPQQPSYGPQQPQQPSYGPQQPSYSTNPWLSKTETDPWNQRPVASQLEIDSQKQKEAFGVQDSTEEIENPWTLLQSIPANLSRVPCNNGDIHRLNNACTNIVVCRNGRPQLVQCVTGLTYDRPSDSCKPFSIAKC
nr:leucine-rich repeat extensin-like protein 5 isoform X1 [Osmia lignaria]